MKSEILVQETDGQKFGKLKMDISSKTTVGGWQGKRTTKENLYTTIVSNDIESHRTDTMKMNFPVKSEFGKLQRRTESEGNILSTITTEKDNRRLNIMKNSTPKSIVDSWHSDDDIVSTLSQSSERPKFAILKEKLGIHIDDMLTSAKSKWHKKGKNVDNLETSTKPSLEKLNGQGKGHENIYVTMDSTELRSESKVTMMVTETEQTREGREDKLFIERVRDGKDSHRPGIMKTNDPVKSNFGRLQRRASSEGNLLSALNEEKDSPRFSIIKNYTRESPAVESWHSDDDIVNSLSKEQERPRFGILKEKVGRWHEHGKHIDDMLTSAKSNIIKWHKKGKSVDNLVTPAKSSLESWNRQGNRHENIYVTMTSTELRSETKATKEEVAENKQTGDDCKDRLYIAMAGDRKENHISDVIITNKPVKSSFGRLQRRAESEGNILSVLNSEKDSLKFNITKSNIGELPAVENWHSDDDIANALNKRPERPRFGILKEKLGKWHEHGKHIDDMLTSAKSNLVKWHNKGKSVDNLLTTAKSTLERWHRKGKSQENIYVTMNSTEIKSKSKRKDAKKKAGPLKMFEDFSSDSDSSGREDRDGSSVRCAGSYENLFGYKDITKCHYVETNDRRCCSNPDCSTVFTFKVHPHHCRSCGEVFCGNCLKLRRKLDRLAQYDPDGLSCKVCETCFWEGTETECLTTTRSLTEEFLKTRAMAKTEMNNIYCDFIMQRNNSSTIPAFWREQFEVDIIKESRRLLEGFSAAVCNSGKYIHKTIQELRKIVDVPAWQKSVFWTLEKMVTSCRICHAKFRKFHNNQKLRNCRVCGLALCKTCSNKELLVYFDDNSTQSETKRPKIAIIKFHGSPEVEPELSVLLYVCTDCKSEVLQRQLKDPEWFEEKPQPVDTLTKIVKLHDELTAVQKKILERENEVNELTQDSERNLEAQDHPTLIAMETKLCNGSELLNEIEAGLSEFHAYVFTLKEMRQSDSSKQLCRLLQNIIKGKCDFYWQHKQILRDQQLKIPSLPKA